MQLFSFLSSAASDDPIAPAVNLFSDHITAAPLFPTFASSPPTQRRSCRGPRGLIGTMLHNASSTFRTMRRQQQSFSAPSQPRASSTSSESTAPPFYLTATAAGATAAAIGSAAWYYTLYGQEAFAMTPAEEGLHPTQYPWEHTKWNKTYDHAALRRGFQVYREVCAACHSLKRIPYREAVGNFLTLSDYLPSPYKNDEAARAANNGALPPDLSLIVKARHGGCDYIFSLLTGYPEDPPAGASVQSGLNFNPYFPGTGIAMARVLFDGLVEYEDGTPATTSQMAKDVVEFLNWAAEPEADDRKKMGYKAIILTTALFALSVWVKRYKWSPIKTRKIVYKAPPEARQR
ncbi:hypothetical protein DV735_g813, partial [Chaetothyriales sp. CBS 134920]